jgi:CRP-like cAMP-binding protein
VVSWRGDLIGPANEECTDLYIVQDGAVLLVLRRDRLRALAEDDPALGNAIIWNIAATLALRLRLSNWQQQLLLNELQEARGGEVTG